MSSEPAKNRSEQSWSSQDELFQVALDNHVLHRAHSDLEQVSVRRVGEVSVDLLLGVPAQRAELVEEVLAGRLVIIFGPVVVGESVLGDGAVWELLPEEIHLVEEEDHGRFREPVRVGDGLPEHQGLVHLVLQLTISSQHFN